MAIALDFENGQQLVYELTQTGDEDGSVYRIENDTVETPFKDINGQTVRTIKEIIDSKIQVRTVEQSLASISGYLPESDQAELRAQLMESDTHSYKMGN